MIRLAENTNKFLNRFLFEEVLGLPLPAVGSLHFAARKSARPCSPTGFGLPPCRAALLRQLSLRRLRRLSAAKV